MKKFILTLSFLAIYMLIFGQQGDGGTPKGLTYFVKSGIEIANYSFDQPDIDKLKAEDRITDSLKTGPWRFGYNYSTSLDLYNSGTWSTMKNGDKIWIMEISSERAKTINLTFSNTSIPEGNELYVYNPDKSFVLGKFTNKHIYKGELGAELVPGNTVLVEYYVPSMNSDNIGNVEISTVTHGYRSAEEYQTKALGSSGSCNMNVNCSDGEPYQNQRNSAVMLVSGSNGFCSGALINNTQFDGTPYVLTANHCYGSGVTNWIFRFNWQADDCNNPGNSPSFLSLSGAVERARRTPSDFLLIEITGGLDNGTVPETHTPYFAGWDNGNAAPSSTFGIHHPSGDIKKISFDDDPASSIQAMGSSEANSSWAVVWDRNTTTEGGSSGSPLFNSKGHIIGQLWGGGASCGNTSSQDFYGRVYNSWEPSGSTNAGQLKHWLDPTDDGSTSIVGHDPYNAPLLLDVTVLNIKEFEDNVCAPGFNPKVNIFNSGTTTLTSLTINYSYNGAANQSFNWTGSLSTYESESIQLPWINNINGSNTISIQLISPNGQTDEDLTDNLKNVNYQAIANGVKSDLEFYLGCYQSEVSWELRDDSNNLLYSGSDYGVDGDASNLISEEFCLAEGCYELTLNDTYGDGVEGALYNTCNFSGSMTLTQSVDNQVLAELLEADADFGFSTTYSFCIDNASLSMNELDGKVKIYPNPSRGIFNIIMDFQGEKKVSLTSLTGEIVGVYQLSGNELQINEPQLAAGVYMLNISNENNSINRKLIIE